MGLPTEANKSLDSECMKAAPTLKGDPIGVALAVVGNYFYSGGITDYHDWAEVIRAKIGPEVAPYLADVWKVLTDFEAVQMRPLGKTQPPPPNPTPPMDALADAKTHQLTLFPVEPIDEIVQAIVLCQFKSRRQPSPWELLCSVESRLGWKARWHIRPALQNLAQRPSLTHAAREYLKGLLESGDLDTALKGAGAPKREVLTGIDSLLRQSKAYRNSGAFQEMVSFMANFRDYAPYNNMLVRVQNPTCSFYATETDWVRRFERHLKEDARPMLILAPMHPVMLVYDLDQTEGPRLPEEVNRFARFEGEWNPLWLRKTVRNAAIHDRIRVGFKPLSSTNAGFAAIAPAIGKWKMRIVVHSELDEPSRYGVLCHELAHIYLGHLGSDWDRWWASRSELDHAAVEIEAEAVAFIVTTRLGLSGNSAAYVSRYLKLEDRLPASVSLDLVAKVASRIEEMARRKLPRRAATSSRPLGDQK
jgi:hypothetical protein